MQAMGFSCPHLTGIRMSQPNYVNSYECHAAMSCGSGKVALNLGIYTLIPALRFSKNVKRSDHSRSENCAGVILPRARPAIHSQKLCRKPIVGSIATIGIE